MAINIPGIWIWICIAFAVVLITSLIMGVQGKQLYTKDVVLRKFNILDLQFAASSVEIINIIKGIKLLPPEKSKKALAALKGQLYVDFAFMPAAYGGIFLLCMKVAGKTSSTAGINFFAALAWLQIIALLCDVYENFYLLNKLKSNTKVEGDQAHKTFQRVVASKWGISLFATVCSLAALSYFWLAGRYSVNSLPYLLIVCIEMVLFVVFGKILSKRLKPSFGE